MLAYDDVEAYVRAGLTSLGYGPAAKPMPVFHPGPAGIERLVRRNPGPLLFLTIGNGIGLTTEALYDQTFITPRTVGRQNDYAYAERLAHDVDTLLLECVNGKTMGEARVLYVTRTGGAPQLVELDNGERYHYQATYITEVKR